MINLSQSAQRLIGQPMFKLLNEIRKRERSGQDFIHFEIGDPDFLPPKQLILNTMRVLRKGNHNRYCSSQGIEELREEIAWFHSMQNNISLTADNVVIAPGCNPLIYCLLKCLCDPGDEVIYPNPGFPTYEAVIKMLSLVSIRITNDTKVKIINYPSNPEGFIVGWNYLNSIFSEAKRKEMTIISDEIYQLITYENESPSMLSVDPNLENTVIISGYSKAFSMTGWRIGYMIGPERLCEKVALLLQTIVSCTNTFVQQACIGLLRDLPSELKENIQELKERRDLIVDGLNSIPGIKCSVPEGAFYVFPSIKGTEKGSSEVCQALLEHGVAALVGTDFGNAGEGFIRLAYCATSKEKIQIGIDRMKKALKKGE